MNSLRGLLRRRAAPGDPREGFLRDQPDVWADVDMPVEDASVHSPHFRLVGWVVDATGPVDELEVLVDGHRVARGIPVDRVRQDIVENFPEAHGPKLGFDTFVRADRPDGPARLVVRAWRADRSCVTLCDRLISLRHETVAPDVIVSSLGSGVAERRPTWVAGHAWHASPTVRIDVRVDGESVGAARLGLPTLGATSPFTHPDVPISGFERYVDFAAVSPTSSSCTVQVEATFADGTVAESAPVGLQLVDVDAGASPALAPRTDGAPVLVATHDLGLGGGQLYLQELLRRLAARDEWAFHVVAGGSGLLRDELQRLGMSVGVDGGPDLGDPAAYVTWVERAAAWIRDRGFIALLGNTFNVFWWADAAQRAGIDVHWALHESFPPGQFFVEALADGAGGSRAHPRVQAAAIGAIGHARSLVFEADATRMLYEPIATDGATRTIPYGVDFSAIDTMMAERDRSAVRASLDVEPDHQLVVCVGTFEPRKAQAVLAQAVGSLAHRHPRLRLALVGDRAGVMSQALHAYVEAGGLDDVIRFIPIGPDIDVWYQAADLLVCASDVESLPRTILEAMAWEVPVLGTRVFGIPELLTDGETGFLCEPSDLESLEEALDRVLQLQAADLERVGRAGGQLVRRRHDPSVYDAAFHELLEQSRDAAAMPAHPERNTP